MQFTSKIFIKKPLFALKTRVLCKNFNAKNLYFLYILPKSRFSTNFFQLERRQNSRKVSW